MARLSDDELTAMLDAVPQVTPPLPEVRRAKADIASTALGFSPATSLPVIQTDPSELPRNVSETIDALAAAGIVYQRASALVRVARLDKPAAGQYVSRAAGDLVIIPVDRDYAAIALARAASFAKFDKRAKQWVRCEPSKPLISGVLASAGEWGHIPNLTGITETPCLRLDGTILDRPGWDDITGLYFDPGETAFPKIANAPTRPQARAALDTLLNIIKDFAFATEADRSVALAATITAVVRRPLRSAPLFVLSAPKMGAGKTLLATIVSYIASGRAPAVMSQADDTESERKRVLALLSEGGAVFVIDNIERPMSSDVLCSVLSEPVYRDRILGCTKTIAVPTNTTWLATGNNVLVKGDLTTRVLLCRLDPQCERPEERRFQANLHDDVPRRRAELVAAVLTVVRAYLASGDLAPNVPPFGRFEEWQRWCRYPLIWLGERDPCETRASIEARDPARELLVELLQALHNHAGSNFRTIAELITDVQSAQGLDGTAARLCQAMLAVAGQSDVINPRRFGNFLSKHERRIEGGLRIEKGNSRQGVATWRVSAVGSEGLVGLSPTPTRETAG